MKSKSVLLWVGAIFTLVVPALVGVWTRDASTTWVVAICGAFVTVLTRLDDLVEISMGPVRAKMRETIREANATIEQLRTVAATTAQVALTDLMAGNFMGGTSLEKRLELHDRIIETLRNVGVPEAQIRAAESDWRKGIGVIYHRIVRHYLEGRTERNHINLRSPPELLAASKEFHDLLDFKTWSAPDPGKMESFITEKGFMNEAAREWIADYRHFLDSGEIRRREVFVTE